MRKSDLKTGMWVENRDGGISMVLLGTKHGDIISGQAWLPLHALDDNLRYGDDDKTTRGADIMRVYAPSYNMAYLKSFPNIDKSDLELIWERKDNSEEINNCKKIINKAQKLIEDILIHLKELESNN